MQKEPRDPKDMDDLLHLAYRLSEAVASVIAEGR